MVEEPDRDTCIPGWSDYSVLRFLATDLSSTIIDMMGLTIPDHEVGTAVSLG
jgi:hypothetical protein